VANLHMYRVISMYQPFPWAIEVSGSRSIRFRNVHCYSNSKVSFDATVHDPTHGVEIRQREFAWLDVSGDAPVRLPRPASPVLARGAEVEKLAGGFFDISGGAADPSGDFYFVDAHWQRIYRWSSTARRVSTVADSPLDPVNLAFDKAGNLLVVSYAGKGTVYSFKPGASRDAVTVVPPEAPEARAAATAVLPTSDWRLNRAALERPARHYLSPDGTTFIPAGEDFVDGATSWGIKSSALIRSFGLAPVAVGRLAYVTDESDQTTWVGAVGADGSVSGLTIFAYMGGEGVAVDAQGNVYIAAGQIYVYDRTGTWIDTIEVPERPLQLVFGGKDRQTLFIAARTSLYAVEMRNGGR
jgi:sugar lactone lactonase YvrE